MIAVGSSGSQPRRQVPPHVLAAAVQRIASSPPANQAPGAVHHAIAQQLVQHAQMHAQRQHAQTQAMLLEAMKGIHQSPAWQQADAQSAGFMPGMHVGGGGGHGPLAALIADAQGIAHSANGVGQDVGNAMAGFHPIGAAQQIHPIAQIQHALGGMFGGGGGPSSPNIAAGLANLRNHSQQQLAQMQQQNAISGQSQGMQNSPAGEAVNKVQQFYHWLQGL